MKNPSHLIESEFVHDTGVRAISQILKGKHIAIVGGGGIAAIEMPRIARELRRHGATTQFFVTQKCLDFVGMISLEWSSQNPVIIDSSGLSEHICLADALLVAPATADILSQARHGICQNAATTIIQSAFGKQIPVGFMPTMHASMWNSPIIQENCNALKKIKNVFFIEARREEQKEKLPSPDKLSLVFAHYVNKLHHTCRKSVFITLGSTRIMIDPVRCLANLSTGKLGWETAKLFYGMGHHTTVLAAQTNFPIEAFQDMSLYTEENYSDIYAFCEKYDFSEIEGFFHFLAASDYLAHQKQTKIKSKYDELKISLKKAKKIRDLKNIQKIHYKFFCKLTSNKNKKNEAKIKEFLFCNNAQGLFWNTPDGAWNKENLHKGMLVKRMKDKLSFESCSGKQEIAQKIYTEFVNT